MSAREAMREGEITNAVSFLTHANVAASSDVSAKRAFLTSKGLREDEIDEAFRRCGGASAVGGTAFAGAQVTPAVVVPARTFTGTVTRAAAMVGLAYLAWPKAREATERARAALARASAEDARARANAGVSDDGGEGGVSVSRAVEAVEARELANKVASAAEAAERAARETKQLRDEITSEVSDALRQSVSDVKAFLAEARRAAEEEKTKANTVSVEVEASFKRAIDDVKKELRDELQGLVAQSPTMATTSASVDDRLANELRAEISQLKEIMMATPSSRGAGASPATATVGKSSVARDWPFEASPQGSESGESPVYTPVQMLRPGDDEFTSHLLRRDEASGSRSATPKGSAAEAPHPQNFMDILEMLEAGKTPPGIRDIDDSPPNPMAAIPRTSRTPPGKPWDARTPTSALADDDAEDENVPIKRIVANAVESPWRPPAAPTLSRVMSQSPRSPRRSVERSVSPTNEASSALSASKTVI
jgi:peroxin-14